MADPRQGVAYTHPGVNLWSTADPGRFLRNHTFVTGDVKVQTDGGSFANIGTLPVETPAGSGSYPVVLTAGEMGSGGPGTGSKINVQFADQDVAPLWTDFQLPLDAPVQTAESLYTALVTVGGVVPTAIADTCLNREVAAGVDTGSDSVRTWRQYLYHAFRSRFVISGTTLTVYKPNDTTVSHTVTLTPAPGADPVGAGNPAGP